MGNLKTPGVVKFFWSNENLQTKYENIHQIPVIDIWKSQSYIVESSENPIAIVHYKDSQKCLQFVHSKLREVPELKIYAVSDQNSKQTFQMMRKTYESSKGKGTREIQKMGKMNINGERTHPLFKYLKKNCHQFYNYQTNSSKRNIDEEIGMFMIRNSKDPKNLQVKYYNEAKIDKFIEERKKQRTQSSSQSNR